MGTLFSTLDLGRSGLQVAQVQLDVAGNNIANVNKAGYSRQRVEVVSKAANYLPYGALGRGPAVAGVERLREDFLDVVYRQQVPQLGNTEVQSSYFGRTEDIFQEPGENGFAARFSQFFDAVNDFANNVESLPGREALLAEGDAISGALREAAGRVNALRSSANEEVRGLVPEINSLTGRIAELNRSIRDIELNGTRANDIRDDRDLLVDELAKISNISYREDDSGAVNILIGGDPLVTGTRVRELKAEPTSTIDPSRGDLLEVRFVDKDSKVNVQGGKLYGLLKQRDVELASLDNELDTIAHGLIESMNKIHNTGNGIENFSSLSSTNMDLDLTTPLSQLSPPFDISDGNFQIRVYDSTGALAETFSVPIIATGPLGTQTTTQDIVNAINGSARMTANLGSDGKIIFQPQAGFTFNFANDTSNVLTALGVNGFFNGTDASSIQVNSILHENPLLLSSGYSADNLATGDNRAALDMAGLRTAKVLENNTQTVQEFYQSVIARVGVNTRTNNAQLTVQQSFVQQFDARRQEVSGVSIDEEVTNLIQFQRAYQASARVISVADNLLETLISVVQ